ncbi:hypothetical protein CLV40_102112 [Actinokineospora auranticolor]|uniref:Uncharacterized protein n=1 Tax=Actinokineospora auranticolor TaxID=155976 RepID=A0A2S6GYG2_9PSEU|nr:hypothetical protein CLV40_102112 [Actinokineospora auranticolor]
MENTDDQVPEPDHARAERLRALSREGRDRYADLLERLAQ